MSTSVQIILETPNYLAINKPAHLVVHDVPGQKHSGKTLVDWLLKNFPEIKNEKWENPERAGIVHRLDAETSGVMVLAKNPQTLQRLQKQFKSRKVQKTYIALVAGDTSSKGEFTGNIIRIAGSTKHTLRTLNFPWDKGKSSFTEFERTDCFELLGYPVSLLHLHPKTGRTHQLRVQLSHNGTPILGDKLYGTKYSDDLSARLNIERHLLHAKKLEFTDPQTGDKVSAVAPIPKDFAGILDNLHQTH